MPHVEHGVENKLQARSGNGSSGIIAAVVAALAAWAVFWSERARERRTLAGLDDRMLKDIGLTRADVAAETDKPFWQV